MSDPRPETPSAILPVLPWRSSEDGRRHGSSPQWNRFTGQEDRHAAGFGWLEAIHPEDREGLQAAWRSAPWNGHVTTDHRVLAADGGAAWFRSGAAPMDWQDAAPATWYGSSVAIEDLTAALAAGQNTLSALQHRVRNTLGRVRSIARLTLRGDEAVSDYAASLDGRISAIARVQAALVRDPLAETDLAQLVAGELTAVIAYEGRQVSIDGPAIRLRARAAENLGMAIYEMTTNALRHGALSTHSGQIDVRWHVAGAGAAAELQFQWLERGHDPTLPHPFRGVGNAMLDSLLSDTLRAKVTRMLNADGYRVVIDIPLADNVASA